MSTLGERLRERRVIICAGAGGVGKTTVSAAIALHLAREGRRVAVVTIDPARRLAESLGLERLGNEPQRVDPGRLALGGRGELWAMMLDAKRTFDELIGQLAPDARTRDEILANRIYRNLSEAIAGSQEYTAIAKLYDLTHDARFDAIVLDTPPSRNALDFLDAPGRLTAFLDGRAMRLFLAPAGIARVGAAGTSVALGGLRRLTGVDLLEDLSAFFRAIADLTDGFRRRSAAVDRLLADPATTFLVVTSPEHGAADEAIFFAARLRRASLPFGALIVNRVHPLDPLERDWHETAARLEGALGRSLARRVARTHAQVQQLARRDAASIARLARELGERDPVCVPDFEVDVHDLEALAAVEARLFAAP